MADLEDILDSFCAVVAQTVYPDGTGLPSLTGAAVKVYPGWPVPDDINNDLPKGIVHITVFPETLEHNTTRYNDDWVVLNIPDPTITFTRLSDPNPAHTVVEVGGYVTLPQNVAMIVDNHDVAYSLQPGDTLTSIATALVVRLELKGVAAFNVGPVIYVENAHSVRARVGMWGTSYKEWTNQEKSFSVIIWAGTPALRKTLSGPIDLAIKKHNFLNLPDGSQGRVRYHSSRLIDKFEKHIAYRRDLCYMVDWATTEIQLDPQVTIVQLNLLAPDDSLIKQINL